MELREVTSFYHVAKLRSVSKAAKKLDLGQPTVTTHLRKLESEFSITLFDRIKRPIQLTSEGTILENFFVNFCHFSLNSRIMIAVCDQTQNTMQCATSAHH